MVNIALYDRAFAVFFEGRRSNGGDDAADEPADEAATDLASVCPATVAVQTDWFPESEHGALYQMVGDGYTAGRDYADAKVALEEARLEELRQGEDGEQDPDAEGQDQGPLDLDEPGLCLVPVQAEQRAERRAAGADRGHEALVDAEDQRDRPPGHAGDDVCGAHEEAAHDGERNLAKHVRSSWGSWPGPRHGSRRRWARRDRRPRSGRCRADRR